MKRIAWMNGVLKRKIAKGMDPSIAVRSGRKANRPEHNTAAGDYLQAVAAKFSLTPQEVLRRGVAMFEIAAEAEEAGNSIVVLDRHNVVVREYNDFRAQIPASEAEPIKPTA